MNFGENDMENINDIVAKSRASQNNIELKKVLTYVGEIQPKVIVEIGVHRGYSMEIWKKAFQPDLLIGIENNESQIDSELRKTLEIIIADSHKEETKNLLKTQLNGKQIDFLFIDGDHTFEGVSRDYEFYSPLVRKGGIIGFHDIMLDSEKWRMNGVDVRRFWNQVIGPAGSKYYEFWDEQGQGTGTGIYYKK